MQHVRRVALQPRTALAVAMAVAIAAATVAPPARWSAGQAAGSTAVGRPACALDHRKAVSPTVLNAGQAATVTLAVRPQCRAEGGAVGDLVLADALADSVAYVPGSAQPPAAIQAAGGTTLTWHADNLPAAGLTFTYRLQALKRGHWPTSHRTVATYTDTAGWPGRVQLDTTYLAVRAPGQAGPGGCWIEADRGETPARWPLGLDLPLQLVARARCPVPPQAYRALFVVDAGRTADGDTSLDDQRSAIAQAVQAVPPEPPRIRYGLVGYDATAWTACEPTDDAAEVTGCLQLMTSGDGHDVAAGIREGMDVFHRNQRLGPPPSATGDMLLVYAHGPAGDACGDASAAALEAKVGHALVVTVCVGADCPHACLTEMASSPRYAFTLAEHAQVIQLLRKIFEEVLNIRLVRARIDEVLAPTVDLVAGSAAPVPDHLAGRHLTWIANYVPRDGVTVSYRVRANLLGQIRPVEAATVTVTDASGATWLNAPGPVVRVVPPVRLYLPNMMRDS